MPLIIADRVKETSATTGATAFTLAGAATGYQTFNATVGVGNTCYYVIENPGTTEWEVGLGTLSAATTLTRTTVLKSSNSNTVVTFSTGTKNVFVSFPSSQIANYATLTDAQTLTNKTLSTNVDYNGNLITGQYGGTGVNNAGKTITIGGNLTTSGAFTTTLAATANTSVTLPTTGTLATLAGIESFTNKTMSTNTTWNGNVIPGQYGGTGIANTGFTLTMAGNITYSGAFTQSFAATANTSLTLPTTGTLATLAGAETLSSKVVNLAAGNATVAPLKFTSGTNMTAAAAGNMEYDGTNLYFTPNTTRRTIAFSDSLGIALTDDTTTAATRYITFTSATSGNITTANTSSTKLTFNPSTGDFTAGGNIIANSDERLKENITTIENALDKVQQLRGVEFDWKDNGIHGMGFIAQEVEKVLPDLVKEHDGIKSLAYGNVASLLVEAIKELSIKYNELEEKYNMLIGE